MAGTASLDRIPLRPPSRPVALVASSFNSDLVERLVLGAQRALAEIGAPALEPVWVPGALELPAGVRDVIRTLRPSAVAALGCVIRGETLHFDLVAEGATRGLLDVSLETDVPVAQAVLACETRFQALERSRGNAANKGYEAARAAVAMAVLKEDLAGQKHSAPGRGM